MTDKVFNHLSALCDSLSGEVGTGGPIVMTKGAFAVEFMDDAGDKWLRFGVTRGTKTWEARGMLDTILLDMDAYEIRTLLEEDDD